MTGSDPGQLAAPTPSGDDAARQEQFRQAVDALTDTALTPTAGGGVVDFADHFAAVLAAVTANVGSLDRLLARRSGSWEASLVADLVTGTVGHDDAYLWEHRTRPVVVPVHVAELVEDRYGHPGPDQARGQVEADHQAHRDAAATDDELDAVDRAEDAAQAALDDAWRAAYRAYGDAFTRAVHDHAAQLTTLRAQVGVAVVDDPDAHWWSPNAAGLNPSADADPLVWALWQHAADTVPLPVDDHGRLTARGDQ